jgi:hypothetical protein
MQRANLFFKRLPKRVEQHWEHALPVFYRWKKLMRRADRHRQQPFEPVQPFPFLLRCYFNEQRQEPLDIPRRFGWHLCLVRLRIK